MSLFAHLALQFGTHPENLATEALGYLLGRSRDARRGLLASLRAGAPDVPADLRFVTQVSSEDQGRPDLAGLDEGGQARVLIEAKFWAGFTEQQPLGYLDQLPPTGVLLVLGPHVRLAYLRRELLLRLRTAGRPFDEVAGAGDEGLVRVGERYLVVSSWRRILNAIRTEVASDAASLADVSQLAGLCDRMDSEAFLPVTSAEMSSGVIRRYHEFGTIVDEVAAQLAGEGVISKKGARAAAANGWYGRYARLRGVGVLLHVSTYKWTLLAPNPLWVTVFGGAWQRSDPSPVNKLLAPVEAATPGTVYQDRMGFPTLPLRVPVGAERHEVIAAVARRLREIGEVLAPLGAGLGEDAAPPPEGDAPEQVRTG